MFFSSKSASFQMSRPRSLAESFRHAPFRSSKTRRAAATARSTSADDASAICVSTWPVAGLMVSNFFAPSTHCPSINRRPGLIFTLVAVSILHPDPTHRAFARRTAEDGRPHTSTLLRLEHRRPFLHVRRQPFLRVLALE